MRAALTPAARTIPPVALDEDGNLLPPDRIPLSALIDTSEIMRFMEALAELTQMECSALLYDPQRPCPVVPEGGIQAVRAPICQALNEVRAGEYCRCVWDVHAAAHSAMNASGPVAADCVGGENTLYACPISLVLPEGTFPKAGVVVAAQDIFNFHYADDLADILDSPVTRAEELMCRTDQRCPNAAALRRLRAIMRGQTVSFSRQISNRYEEFKALERTRAQQQELSDAYARLDRECKLVGRIQRRLVPQQEPELPGFEVATYYRPARQAGGDYYDFFGRPDGSSGILVADVSGHGADAAVVMAMMRTMMHLLPENSDPPDRVLHYINERLCRDIMTDQFATGLFVVAEGDGDIEVASGGHGAPLLFRHETGEADELKTESGFPLGLMPQSEFSIDRTRMEPGDVLLLFTDGITDVFNRAGETFGTGRLREGLQACADGGATEVRDGLVRGAEDFAEGQPQHDDQTLLVLKKL